MKAAPLFALALLSLVACDKPEATADKPAASASASAAPPPAPAATPSAPPSATAAATASASAAPAAGPTKDAVVSVFDPKKESTRTAKVLAGGSVALYLPEWAGTSWKVTQPDAALGKPKEETIPGFAGPSTPAHAFSWQIKDGLKGQSHKIVLTNTAKGQAGAPPTVFTLGIDVS